MALLFVLQTVNKSLTGLVLFVVLNRVKAHNISLNRQHRSKRFVF